MADVWTIQAKYIFLDIVGYTRNRSVEAQSDIVGVLNGLVLEAVDSQKVSKEEVIYIPTGDGMCVALLNVTEPFDVHLQIALNILSSVTKHNAQAPDEMRKFQIRVGINENVDNLIDDITGRKNVAGAGVSLAQRIMDKADAGQILMGQTVFESLNQREKYMSKFRPHEATVKHGQKIRVYQYVQEGLLGLNTLPPSIFIPRVQEEPKLTKFAAYYFAHAIKLREFLRVTDRGEYPKVQLLWFLASDSVEKSEATDIHPPSLILPSICAGGLREQLAALDSLPFWITCKFAGLVEESPELRPWVSKYFDTPPYVALFVNGKGREKLKSEWPSIWKEFELG